MKTSPEERALELEGRIVDSMGLSDISPLKIKKELTTLITKADAWDWCDTNLISLYDGGGAWIIEYGLLSSPTKLSDEHFGTPLSAVEAAMKEKQ